MLIVIGILLSGILLGFVLRKRLNEKFLNRFLLYSIYLLLFLMGVGIGTNKQILENLLSLGLQALALTLGAVAGSILVVFLVYKLFFVKKDK